MPSRKPVLMILTSHRRDCFELCLNCLEWFTDLDAFSRIYVLANDVDPAHRQVILDFKARRPRGQVAEMHCAPRARGYNPCLLAMWNTVLEMHSQDLIVKIDEDVFVTPGWLEALLAGYRARVHGDCVLVSALVPNNDCGRATLEPSFRQWWPWEYVAPVNEAPIYLNGLYGAWVWSKVLKGGLEERVRRAALPGRPIHGKLSINCIAFGPELTRLIHPLTLNDEHEINQVMERRGRTGWLETSVLVHHYAFYRQEETLSQRLPFHLIPAHFAALLERTRNRARAA